MVRTLEGQSDELTAVKLMGSELPTTTEGHYGYRNAENGECCDVVGISILV